MFSNLNSDLIGRFLVGKFNYKYIAIGYHFNFAINNLS